jgi:hypothetical protein
MEFRCKHCENIIKQGSETTAIISGTLSDQRLDDFKNFYVFHDNCFIEVGGEEYSPVVPAIDAIFEQEGKQE